MRERPQPLDNWRGHVLGILIESGYVGVLLGAAALIAWAVNLP